MRGPEDDDGSDGGGGKRGAYLCPQNILTIEKIMLDSNMLCIIVTKIIHLNDFSTLKFQANRWRTKWV